MKQQRPEHRLTVESADGSREEVISYGVYRMTSGNMREKQKEIRERLAVLGMEDGRELFVPDEEHVIINGVTYRMIEKRPYDESSDGEPT